jgi:hypothetical protein
MAHEHAAAASRVERSTAFSDRTLVVAVLTGLAWLALYAGLTAFSRNSVGLRSFVANVVYLLPLAAAAGLAGFAAHRAYGRVRLVWWLLAASTASWFAGEVVWAVEFYLSGGNAPIPSIADVGYVFQYVFALPAVLLVLRVGVLAQARGLLDALLVGAGVAGSRFMGRRGVHHAPVSGAGPEHCECLPCGGPLR